MSILYTLAVLLLLQSSDPSRVDAELPFVYKNWRTFTTVDGLPHDKIRAVRVWGDKVWVGTEGGLALLQGKEDLHPTRGKTFKSWTLEDGLPWPAISAIDVDSRTEDVWLGTWGGGLVRFTGGRFDRFDQLSSGLAGNLIFAVLVDGDRVWAATNAGISSFDTITGSWSLHMARRADAPQRLATSLHLFGGELYANVWGEAAYRFDVASGQWIPVARLRPADCGLRIVDPRRDRKGGCDTGGDLGLYMAGAPYFQEERVGDVSSGRARPTGYLYRATPTSLLRLNPDGGWDATRQGDGGFTDDLPRCLAVAAKTGEVWLGTDTGLRVLTDWESDSWVTYRHSAGAGVDSSVPDDRIRCIEFQRDDVWVGTVKGLALGVGRKSKVEGHQSDRPTYDLQPSNLQPSDPALRNDVDTSPATYAPPSADYSYERSTTKSVTIAALGPTSRTMALPGRDYSQPPSSNRPDLLALQLAIRELNASGGYRKEMPFVMITGPEGYARYGWATLEDDLGYYTRQREVMGILGRLAPHSRVLTAVASHSEVPVVNVAATPPTVDEIINPWIFRCTGDQPRQYRIFLENLVDSGELSRIAVLRTTESLRATPLDMVAKYLADQAQSRAKLVAEELYHWFPADEVGDAASQQVGQRSSLPPGSSPYGDELGRVLRAIQVAGADVVLTWNDAATSAAIVNRMREIGMTQVFVGSEQIVQAEFTDLVGQDPGTVLAFYPSRADRDRDAARFRQRYVERFKRPPAPDAYQSYLAGKHLLLAINRAGLDRTAIRHTLEQMSRDAYPEHACLESSTPGETMLAHLKAGKWTFEILRRQ